MMQRSVIAIGKVLILGCLILLLHLILSVSEAVDGAASLELPRFSGRFWIRVSDRLLMLRFIADARCWGEGCPRIVPSSGFTSDSSLRLARDGQVKFKDTEEQRRGDNDSRVDHI